MKKLMVLLGTVILSTPVVAAEESKEKIEEIIVSATYRDTRLMDTPLTISAVTEADIMLKGIEDIQTLYQSIPGLSYRTNSQTYNTLSVRGLTPPAGGGASMVGVYMDNLPMTDSNSGGLSQTLGALFDMERVEVLKGPQGTLYGEGNMGGSIRYISNKPDTSGLDYSVQGSIEDMSASDDLSYRMDAMVNVPITDALALRLVGYKRDRAGIIDQVAPRNLKDVDTFEETGYRARLTWFATPEFEVTAMINKINGNYGGPGLGFHCFTQSTPSDPNGQVPFYDLPGVTCAGQTDQFDNGDPYVTHLAHPTHKSGGFDNQSMYNLSLEYELPFAQLISSSSYFDRATDYSEETSPRFSGGLVALVAGGCFGAVPGCGPGVLTGLGGDGSFFRGSERFVQEFRLISNTDSKLQWTVGAYYKDDESQTGHHKGCYDGGSPVYATVSTHCNLQYNFATSVPIEDQAAILLWLNGLVPGNTGYRTFQEKSLYGEASYRINDQWEINAGLRLAEVEYNLLLGAPGVDSKANPVSDLTTNSDIKSPKVTLTWRPMPDWMLYATYSSGFRPGIVNTGLAGKIAELNAVRAGNPTAEAHYQRLVDLQTPDGDKVINTEIGIKATTMDGRLSFVGSLYNVSWEDTLISVTEAITDVPGVNPLDFGFTVNGGSAESEGMELELRFAITDALHLTVGGDRIWTAQVGAGGQARYGGVAIRPGNRLANAPKHSGYFSLAYDFQLFGLDANARADGYEVAESWNTANNERPAPSYNTLDLKLLVKKDKWQIAAYVRNITDEVIVYEFNQVGYRFGRPRSLGIQFNYRM
ncbi:MAG: TonB-dependent receptor [Proteobacteria bacterium]|nr:TonB-dependent receptor [Pseudomonadota bacterium]